MTKIKKLLKQVVGIDISYEKIDVSLGRMDSQTATEVYIHKIFENSEKGYLPLILWVKKHTDQVVPLRYVMEATGVYHQKLAFFLSEKGYTVSIVMPNKVANFFKTLEVKTVTDKTMSSAIAMFGLEKNPENWVAPKKIYRELQQITRERGQIVDERTMIKNQLHAEESEAYPCPTSLKRLKARIMMLNEQIKQIMAEIAAIVKTDAELAASVARIKTIPGIALLTIATILAETDGFHLIKNKRQLASYAGFDIVLKDSGTSVHAKPRISKKGNKYLRKAMHMPALSAIGCSKEFKTIYTRIAEKSAIKMKGVVAIQRKLLELVYTIYITKKPYDPNYIENQVKKMEDLKNKATELIC